MAENALSILIVIFSVHLQQTEISERKLFIFHLGRKSDHMLNSVLNGDWSNAVPGREIPDLGMELSTQHWVTYSIIYMLRMATL